MEIGQLCNLNSEDLRKWYYTSNPVCNFTENSEDNLDNEVNTDFDGNQTDCVNITFEEYIQSHNHESMCSNYFMGKSFFSLLLFLAFYFDDLAAGHNFTTRRYTRLLRSY